MLIQVSSAVRYGTARVAHPRHYMGPEGSHTAMGTSEEHSATPEARQNILHSHRK